MTPEKAIKGLKSYAESSWGDLNDTFIAAIAALEKQSQRPVILSGEECLCPACGFDMMGVWDVPEAEDPKYCPNCGQALTWTKPFALTKPHPQQFQQIAYSKINPNLSGTIIRWVSENQFFVSYQDGYVILAHRDHWYIREVGE